jgi:type IV pilus assembly protein PilP
MTRRGLLGSLFSLALIAGCEEEIVQSDAKPTDPAAAAPAGSAAVAKAQEDEGPPTVEFQEADFNETDRSRDPFRSFSKAFIEDEKSRIQSQRDVVLDQYAIDELRLVGIVTRIAPPRAMLVDPTGRGHVVRRGQFVGRAEIVQGGSSGTDYEINWRVERIRESDIVLVREDPKNPDVPSATRVIPLRPEESG